MSKWLDTDTFLAEYTLIRRGLHQRWGGDPVANSEAYTNRAARHDPWGALIVASNIETYMDELSDTHGLPPSALQRIAGDLRRIARPLIEARLATHRPPPFIR